MERGETVSGREVVRNVDVDRTAAREGIGGNDDSSIRGWSSSNAANTGATGAGAAAAARASDGPHKYVLQDAAGIKVVAFELGEGANQGSNAHACASNGKGIAGMRLGDPNCAIGMKMVIHQGTEIRRGILMLRKTDVKLLGGKVEVWDEAWKKGRKHGLMSSLSGERRT